MEDIQVQQGVREAPRLLHRAGATYTAGTAMAVPVFEHKPMLETYEI